MKKLIVAVAMLALAATVNAQELSGEFPPEGGNITVTASGGDVVAAGLDFVSESGGLIPAPGTDATPFTFFLSNTANQVTYGNLGTSVTFADGSSTTLSVGATAGTSDIEANWGNGPQAVAFPVGPVVPEPASGTLLVLASLFGLTLRRRR